jgi:hypothetical protein
MKKQSFLHSLVLVFLLLLLSVALIILAGCSTGPSQEEIAASVEAQLTVALAETIEAIPTGTSAPIRGDTGEFPTGKFVLDDSRFFAIEFDENGNWIDYVTDADTPSGGGKYAINGNLYTEMTHSYSGVPQVPATYYWTFDGTNLTFELWGEDVNPYRKSALDGRTYKKAE